jgi:Zn-dependent M16 (insulinase) family peptidase
MLLTMRLAVGSAATDADRTFYQFRTAGGSDAFYELLAQHLTMLMKPDFTDEEAGREVASVEVVTAADGRRTLLMKGTVYNEMAASMARPRFRQPRVLKEMVFGRDHPLSRNAGGHPAQLWDLTPDSLRAFHRANYRIGPGLELVAALPLSWSADDFLKRLDTLLTALKPPRVAPPRPPLPPFRPAPRGEVRIDTYPSASADAPQDVLLGWQALPELTPDEWDALEILLQVIGGGDASYLHRDLVDEKTRSFFGQSADRRWHDRLDRVAHALAFVKSVAPVAEYERLDRELTAGRNPWRGLVLRAGLSELPYAVALRPDHALGEREKKEIAARVRRYEVRLADRLGDGDVQKALAAFQAEQDAKTAELAARDQAITQATIRLGPPPDAGRCPF